MSGDDWMLLLIGVGVTYVMCAAVYLAARDGIGWFDPRRKS